MITKIHCLVGLPGSGKTFLGNSLRCENSIFVDDLKERTQLPDNDAYDVLIIADVNLCNTQNRKKATEILAKMYPNASFEWYFFENDPIKCRKNVHARSDGRYVDPTISRFTKEYQIPEDVTPIIIFQKE